MTAKKTHGHTQQVKKKGRWQVVKSFTYNSWEAMNRRCSDPKHPWYDIYGGRGIEVCERWRRGTPNAFINFLTDMGERPAKNMTLDRRDANLGYYKDNCQWADKPTQRLNQRTKMVIDVEPINSIPY
jgi:hypothetical protein